jgi:hypothetical protein
VSWSGKRESIVVLFSTKVEYIALMEDIKEVVWL